LSDRRVGLLINFNVALLKDGIVRMVNRLYGRRFERPVGIAIVHAAGAKAPDFVVFAEPGDMTILGARSLAGLNVRVDSQRKQLVPAGPILAGTASESQVRTRR